MEAINQKIADVVEKERMVAKKISDLKHESHTLKMEIHWLEQERLKASRVLTPDEEETLKKELTAVGELLELVAVISGSLRVVSEESDDSEKLYSIAIDCGTSYDTGLTGLYAKVVLKTKVPKVEAIVKELFEQVGTVRGRGPTDLVWEKDWDDSTSIKLTSHEALSY
jgi:hypothetical protein